MQCRIASDKVAMYIRWSTEDQGQGHTLEIQRESCRYYALSQGWAVNDALTYIDDGHSGSTLERPALARLRAAVNADLVDCVVVYKLDRLSRNIKDIINLVLDEWDERCAVRSAQEPVDTTTDAGKMFFTLLGSFADFERSTIRTRTWSGKRKNAEKGRNPGMAYPFGFEKSEDGGFALVDAEATTVREIFDQYLKGGSCRLIAFDLNRRGLLTRSGRPWANADISRLLRNPLYAGRLVYNRKAYALKKKIGRVLDKEPDQVISFEGAAPAIVTTELWEEAQRTRLGRPRVGGPGRSPRTHSSPYLLAGLLRCRCGHAWIGVQGGQNAARFYSCAGARSSGPSLCASRMIKTEALDQFVLDRVRLTWPLQGPFSTGLLERLAEQTRQHREGLEGLRRRHAAMDEAVARFRADYKRGKLSAEAYMELTEEARQEREGLVAQMRAVEAEAAEVAATQVDMTEAEACFARLDLWETLELGERQQILRMLIDQIKVARPKGSQEVQVHIDWHLARP